MQAAMFAVKDDRLTLMALYNANQQKQIKVALHETQKWVPTFRPLIAIPGLQLPKFGNNRVRNFALSSLI